MSYHGRLPNKRTPYRKGGRFAKAPSLEAAGLVLVCESCGAIHVRPFPVECRSCGEATGSGGSR